MYKIISDISRYKGGKSLDRKDFSESFNLFMINRSISMHSDINVEILNSTVNILYKTLSAEQHYMLMMRIIPKTSYTKKYIKTPKWEKKTKDEDDVSAYFEESMKKINSSIRDVFGDK